MSVNCPHCGSIMTKKSRYCQWCGQYLEASCPSCYNPVNLANSFCQWCGASLDSLKPITSERTSTLPQGTETVSGSPHSHRTVISVPVLPSSSLTPQSMLQGRHSQQKESSPLAMLMLGLLASAIIAGGTWLFTLDALLAVIALLTTFPTVVFWTVLKYFNEKSGINQQYVSGSVVIFFFAGVIIIIPIIVAEFTASFIITFFILLFANGDVLVFLFVLLVGAAFIEEAGKLVIIKKAVHDHAHVSVMRSIYFGLIAVLAFASVENVLYVLGALEGGIEDAIFVSFVRSLLSVPLHVLTGTFIAQYYLKHLRYNPTSVLFRPLSQYPPLLHQGHYQPWSHPNYSSQGRSPVGRWHYLGIPSLIHLCFNVAVFFLSNAFFAQIYFLGFLFVVGVVIIYSVLYFNFKWFWKVKKFTLSEFLHAEPQL